MCFCRRPVAELVTQLQWCAGGLQDTEASLLEGTGGAAAGAGGKQHIKQPSFLCFIHVMFLFILWLPSSVSYFLLEVTGTGDQMKHDTYMTWHFGLFSKKKPMLLNYCRREIFPTHLFSRKTRDSYFWSSFISITVFRRLSAALWQCQSHQVTLAFGAQSEKRCAFRFTWFVYRVLEIGDGGDTQQCSDRAGRHLRSSALHFRLQWVHQRVRFFDSPLILGYKHKYMQIQTHWHEHSFHFGCCICGK